MNTVSHGWYGDDVRHLEFVPQLRVLHILDRKNNRVVAGKRLRPGKARRQAPGLDLVGSFHGGIQLYDLVKGCGFETELAEFDTLPWKWNMARKGRLFKTVFPY